MNDGYIKWYGKVIDRDKVVNTKRMQREHVTKLHALWYAFLTDTLVKWLTGYPDIDISTDTIQVKITFSDKVVLNKTNDSWKKQFMPLQLNMMPTTTDGRRHRRRRWWWWWRCWWWSLYVTSKCGKVMWRILVDEDRRDERFKKVSYRLKGQFELKQHIPHHIVSKYSWTQMCSIQCTCKITRNKKKVK